MGFSDLGKFWFFLRKSLMWFFQSFKMHAFLLLNKLKCSFHDHVIKQYIGFHCYMYLSLTYKKSINLNTLHRIYCLLIIFPPLKIHVIQTLYLLFVDWKKIGNDFPKYIWTACTFMQNTFDNLHQGHFKWKQNHFFFRMKISKYFIFLQQFQVYQREYYQDCPSVGWFI